MDAAKKKTETVPSGIPAALEARRKAMGISREKFAVQSLNISSSTYARWIAGNFNPNLKMLQWLQARLVDWEFIPAQCTPETYPELAKLWDNPSDDIYDDL
jgi:transcriptional regulator with XRE-family HTH domain